MVSGENPIDVKSFLYLRGREWKPICRTQDPTVVDLNDLASNKGGPSDPAAL